MRIRVALAVLPLLALPLACAPEDEDNADDPGASDSSTPAGESPTDEPTAEETDAGGLPPECAVDQLPVKEAGFATIGTDSPAYEPWFVDDDPSNGQGYESAVAYAVANTLGLQVKWVVVPFNSSYKPGEKDFDFDINQISITPERSAVVDFSDGYYDGTQAVVALKDSEIAKSTSIGDLASFKLGAQTGTTSLTAARDIVDEPAVFEDTNAAKQALLNDQVDGIVADLPTATYISDFEIKGSVVVGQFVDPNIGPDKFGMLFEKGSELVPCVNAALAILTADGTVEQLQAQWLADYQAVPVLQ